MFNQINEEMKKTWRNVLTVALVAVISSVAAIGTTAYVLNNKEAQSALLTEGTEGVFKQPVRLANYNTVAAENTDFTYAAEAAVHAVVHIKSVATAKDGSA